MHHSAFFKLSETLRNYLHHKTSQSIDIQKVVRQAEIQNPWFIEQFVNTMFSHIADLSDKNSIDRYVDDLKVTSHPKNILVIAAGNVPMVSFHDVMSVLLSGHRLVFKPSSKDGPLMNMLLFLLQEYDRSLSDKIFVQENHVSPDEIDAVIATGTNNTAMHLNYYFSKYPRIIRHNRTSIAVLDNTVTDEELKNLADDIMLYFGLGCRNVSKIFIPKDFDIQRIFAAIYEYTFFMQHHKYMNNYDYYRSIYLLNKEEFLDNHFFIVKESKHLHAPVANLFYETYDHISEVERYLEQEKDNIQIVVGRNYTNFGRAQFPDINEFADGINTKKFLMEV